MAHQIWDIKWEHKEVFTMKVLVKTDSFKDSIELYYSMCSTCIGKSENKELWFVEEDMHGVNTVKSKFKWEKH